MIPGQPNNLNADEDCPLTAATRNLSPRQRQTLWRLVLGRSESEIAGELGLSPHTVHDYVKQLYRRLEVRSRAELLALFIDDRLAARVNPCFSEPDRGP